MPTLEVNCSRNIYHGMLFLIYSYTIWYWKSSANFGGKLFKKYFSWNVISFIFFYHLVIKIYHITQMSFCFHVFFIKRLSLRWFAAAHLTTKPCKVRVSLKIQYVSCLVNPLAYITYFYGNHSLRPIACLKRKFSTDSQTENWSVFTYPTLIRFHQLHSSCTK